MKLIKTFHKFRLQFLTKLPNLDVYLSVIAQLIIFTCIAVAIWYGGPLLSLKGAAPLAQTEKRLYLIGYLGLVWLLKLLMIDFDVSNFFHHHNPEIRKHINALQNRFNGVMHFLKHTTTQKGDYTIALNELPWHLLIGHAGAGKTALLANSKVHFILQRQPSASSEHCDWWVTREASIVDVPGKYLISPTKVDGEKNEIPAILWRSFLGLIKKHRGKNSLSGIIIALPLPEMMKQGDSKKYQAQLRHLLQRIHDVQRFFPEPLPCNIIITKCDLLAGFNEFFAETGDDEITQAWGLSLKNTRKNKEAINEQFNLLIKKLNQQLLWRLHQERNPMARPYIKDFPLQVERLKEYTLDFINKLNQLQYPISVQGIYLTSALQTKPESEETIIDTPNNTQRAIQLFKEPVAASRAYFIKQFILHGLSGKELAITHTATATNWKRRTAIATSLGVITIAGIIFGNDFEQGVKQAYAIQNTLSSYQLSLQQIHDPEEQLEKTLNLLNSLQQIAHQQGYKLDTLHLLTFYSNKSTQKSNAVYQQALQNILLPELQTYLSEYLHTPINRNIDHIYAALKSYLMLGDASHLSPTFITNTTQSILPRSFSETASIQLVNHINAALSAMSNPLTLDNNLIQETRKYLQALPSAQLSYIILKNIDSNNLDSNINLGINNAPFTSKITNNGIPKMFTAQAFNQIINEQADVAAKETAAGNWVLGNALNNNQTEITANILEQLRTTYINNYIGTWETAIANINLEKPTSLAETNQIILNLISTNSPLLQLLHTLHDNTYFEPITSTSPTLLNLGLLVDNANAPDVTLNQILSGLQQLHQHLNSILTAENERKAAFDAVSLRMQHSNGDPDIITQLRIIAEQSPEPLKAWLDKITNDAWHYLMQDATHYMDTSWQEQVGHVYQTEIANHYPFSQNATQEVALSKFIDFFGNPGAVISYYNQILKPFVDTDGTDWHWKTIDNQKLPFSDDTLHQVHNAMRIHHMFFPNGDDKLHVQFALQPHTLSKAISKVMVSINDKKITDMNANTHPSHLLVWPNKHEIKMTSVQFTLDNNRIINRDFPGDWGWFKLVNQSYVSANSRKEIVINLSEDSNAAEYILFTQSGLNPFIAFNLQNLHLPAQLIDKDKLPV